MFLEKLFDYLIDANVFVLVAACTFLCVEVCLSGFGYRKSYATRLWLLTASLMVAASLPLISYVASLAQLPASPHVSDILIAQYLKGNLTISAVNFDSLLSARTATLQAIHSGSNIWVTAGVAAIVAAMIARMVYILISMARVAKVIRDGHCVRNTKNVRIVVSSETDVPFSTRGIGKYYVVVPQSLLEDGKTLAIAIGHEFQHIRHKDVTVEFLLAVVSPFFIFNPGYWLLSKKLRKLREHTCDIEFLERSHHGTRAYAKALLKVAKQASKTRRLNRVGSLAVPFVGRRLLLESSTKSSLAARIMVLADGNCGKPHKAFLAALLVMVAGMMFVGAAAFKPSTGWSHDRIMISSVANLERLNSRNNAVDTQVLLDN